MSIATIHFEVIGKPATQGSKRAFIAGGRAIVTEDCERNRPWRSDVRSAAMEAVKAEGFTPPALCAGPVRLTLVFRLARPKGHFGTGRNADRIKDGAPEWPTGKPDTVKLARAVEDACKEILWRDDSQVVVEQIQKVWAGGDAGQQGVSVTAEAL